MKQYFAKHQNGSITYCNRPIKETGEDSYSFDVNPTDLEAVQDDTKDWKIEDGKLSVIASTRKADAEARKAQAEAEHAQKIAGTDALKEKLSKGEASLAEIQQALHKIL